MGQGLNALKGWPEIVPPLGNAMGLIDNDGAYIPEFLAGLEHGVVDPFWGHVQKLGRAKADVVQDSVAVVSRPSLCVDAQATQRLALVFHQGDQGRDHNA